MINADYMNGWIKVKENIGTDSKDVFGRVGTKIKIVEEDSEIKELQYIIITKTKLMLEYVNEDSSTELYKDISNIVLNFCEALSILNKIEEGK